MARGRAKLAIGQGLSVWVLEAPDGFGDADYHAHHALQISYCLDGELMLATPEDMAKGQALAVAADAVHRIEARGTIAFVFVEPESRPGRALSARLFEGQSLAEIEAEALAEPMERLRSVFDGMVGDEQMLAVGRAVATSLAPEPQAMLPDPRVQRIIDYAAAHLDSPLTLAEAAQGVYLSRSRLRHLFVEQTGLAFKTYLLWLRLVRAVQIYSQGASLTEAAHMAGFADSAHFSRIFRRTFGLPPTTLTRI